MIQKCRMRIGDTHTMFTHFVQHRPLGAPAGLRVRTLPAVKAAIAGIIDRTTHNGKPASELFQKRVRLSPVKHKHNQALRERVERWSRSLCRRSGDWCCIGICRRCSSIRVVVKLVLWEDLGSERRIKLAHWHIGLILLCGKGKFEQIAVSRI